MAGRGNYSKTWGPSSKNFSMGKTPPRSMRTQYARVELGGLVDLLFEIDNVAYDEAQQMLDKAAKIGEENMKRLIRERGTQFSKRAQSEGINKGPGRIRTGLMYDSVSSRVEVGPKRINATFGWIDRFEKYFSYQETGFQNLWYSLKLRSGRIFQKNGRVAVGKRRTPIWTNGMFALWDSRIRVQTHLPKLAEDAAAKIVRRINP